MNNVPIYVQDVLDDWEFLAFAAYDWFEQQGRIVIGIEPDPEGLSGARLFWVRYDSENGKPDQRISALLATYDPETEVIVQFMQADGNVRTQRLRTAPGARYPKRVYLFEMLRRIEEESENIDFKTLPEWLIRFCEEFDEMDKN